MAHIIQNMSEFTVLIINVLPVNKGVLVFTHCQKLVENFYLFIY